MTKRNVGMACLLLCAAAAACAQVDAHAKRLFNGPNLTEWTGNGFTATKDLVASSTGGCITSKATWTNVDIQFEFRLAPGASGGVVLRAVPADAGIAAGLTVPLVDDNEMLDQTYLSGSLRGVVAANPVPGRANQWRRAELILLGHQLRVTLDDVTALDTDLAKVAANNLEGLDRTSGALALFCRTGRIYFRDVRARGLAADDRMPPKEEDLDTAQPGDNTPPDGFIAQFNGKDLTGWKGLVSPDKGPPGRAAMTPDQFAAATVKADQQMRDHWKIINGILKYDGGGQSLCTAKDYTNVEMYVDWKLPERGDSGIYLRGSPQVQIWDHVQWNIGSGGLYNNQKGPHDPLVMADNPIGRWNHNFIRMIGDKVWVWLNGKLVTDGVVLENYWERAKPIYPSGQIELQHHGDTLWYKNVYLRELPADAKPDASPPNPM
jgi:hypothetical protein